MNDYRIMLSGCGSQGQKEVVIALPEESAKALAAWDLFGLDCCGGPDIRVEPVDDDRTHAYHRDEDVNETMCGLDSRDVGVSASMFHVDCDACITAWEKVPR